MLIRYMVIVVFLQQGANIGKINPQTYFANLKMMLHAWP